MKLLFIGSIWPEPTSTAAGRRTFDVLDMMRPLSNEIHFACAASKSSFSELPEDIISHDIELNESSFDDWVIKLNPDLVIFDRFTSEEQFGWRIAKQCPNAFKILDTSDLHCLRFARQQALKKQTQIDLFNDLAIREITSILRCDLTLMISQVEIEILKKEFQISGSLLAYFPFVVDEKDKVQPVAFEDRQHIMMIGSFLHDPNWDAVQFAVKEVWPLVQKALPKAQLHLYGSYAAHKHQQMNQPKKGILLKGRAQEAISCMQQYRINLAPLRFGAGQKGKVLEGFLSNTPVVSTPIGFESMLYDVQWPQPISQKPEDIAQNIINAYQNKDCWSQLNQAGAQALQHFDKVTHQTFIQKRIKQLINELEQHRKNNFYGRLVLQQHLRATEFMSRWIEAKNN